MKRRDILKHLSAIPLVGAIPHEDFLKKLKPRGGTLAETIEAGEKIYDSIGVDTIINCRGTFTILGGSVERPEVSTAMEAATGYFVQYDELAYGIGQRLADLTECEWGMVSAGCAAGLKHFTAACVTGGNPEKLIRIPDLTGFEKTEVIIPRQSRNAYDHAVRNIGITVITVETPEELAAAINQRTAMIYIVTGPSNDKGQPLSLEVIAEIAKPHGIPILADAAAEDLTIPPVHLARGATVVAYSGGKAICGPQCAGLLLGKKDILMAAWQASSPHHGPGRDNKVGKEEMMGMLAAVEAWIARDHKAEWQQWLSWLDHIDQKLTTISGVSSEITQPKGLSNHAPVLHIKWDADKLNLTGEEVAEEVARNKPRLAIGSRTNDNMTSINITPNQMQPGNAEVVAERLHGILSRSNKAKPAALKAAQANLTGHWDLEINYFTENSHHKLFIHQDGNWINGTHQTDFSSVELIGMIEGDDIKMKSNFRKPGDNIAFLFTGKASDDKLTGSILLGEYLTAKFTAKRMEYSHNKKPIFIPGGPPLAT
ncbi:MAG: aminotransferase class V-fold PLP-dependent enzyme [Saprospiraceae bacterium]|nr:aminotransferase class V-fold PLP-dependent enzyme [Saprospiraceae bacterium]